MLDDAVFKDENIVEFERWVVMSVGVERDDGKADFLGKNLDAVLFLIVLGFLWLLLGTDERSRS